MKSDFDFIVERNVFDFLLEYIVFDYIIITTKTTVKHTTYHTLTIESNTIAGAAKNDRIIKPFSMLLSFSQFNSYNDAYAESDREKKVVIIVK